MELKEQIEIMTHYLNGGDIEFSSDNFEKEFGEAKKEVDGDLCWNWYNFKYRIKEPKQKVTIEKWLGKDSKGDFIILEASNVDKYIGYKKVKFIETYEVEL